MIYLVTDIDWDTDGEDIDLPSELEIDIPDDMDSEDIEDYVSDSISDTTGFCHYGFQLFKK